MSEPIVTLLEKNWDFSKSHYSLGQISRLLDSFDGIIEILRYWQLHDPQRLTRLYHAGYESGFIYDLQMAIWEIAAASNCQVEISNIADESFREGSL